MTIGVKCPKCGENKGRCSWDSAEGIGDIYDGYSFLCKGCGHREGGVEQSDQNDSYTECPFCGQVSCGQNNNNTMNYLEGVVDCLKKDEKFVCNECGLELKCQHEKDSEEYVFNLSCPKCGERAWFAHSINPISEDRGEICPWCGDIFVLK